MMLNRAALALAFFSVLVVPAQAEILYRGTMQFTAANAACTQGPRAGDIDNAQFHPAAVVGNENFSALNIIFNYGGQSWELLAPGSFTSSFQQTSNKGIGWSAYTPSQPTFLLVSKQTPASLTTLTANVTLVGKVKNPWGNTGQDNCVASFLFVGVKNVNPG